MTEQHIYHTRATDSRQDHFVLFQALRNRSLTPTQMKNELYLTHNVVVSDKSVGKRLYEYSLQARSPLCVPSLREVSMGARSCKLEFTRIAFRNIHERV